jgi:hypothetical protein
MRNLKINHLLAAVVLLLVPSLASVASACTCGGGAPCESYAAASVVFVGRVTQTGFKTIRRSFPDNAMSTTLTNGSVMSAQFKVEEAFLGVKVAQIEILGQGTTCDFPFKSGERYLVFAYKDSKTGRVHTNICTGTASLAESNDYLAYLRKAAKQPAGAAFYGEVVRDVYGEAEVRAEPLAKAEIILEKGKVQLRGVTDASGKFELLGIKPGRYRVHTNPATNASRLDVMATEPRKEWEVDIPIQGCVQAWFAARADGEISGTVRDESGIVADDIEPELLFADDKGSEPNFRSERLSDAKTFKFSFLPPGRYYLGFNLHDGPSIISPYPEFYYPGVADRSRATLITLTEGQKVSDLTLMRPLRLGERVLEGVAVWPDGSPYIENCGITLTNPRTGYREGNCVSPDGEGRFKIKAVEGQTYHLAATLFSQGKGLISSKPVVVKIEKENKPVKLVVESQ